MIQQNSNIKIQSYADFNVIPAKMTTLPPFYFSCLFVLFLFGFLFLLLFFVVVLITKQYPLKIMTYNSNKNNVTYYISLIK